MIVLLGKYNVQNVISLALVTIIKILVKLNWYLLKK